MRLASLVLRRGWVFVMMAMLLHAGPALAQDGSDTEAAVENAAESAGEAMDAVGNAAGDVAGDALDAADGPEPILPVNPVGKAHVMRSDMNIANAVAAAARLVGLGIGPTNLIDSENAKLGELMLSG